ncbi:prolyl-tRNA synthetase, partial [Aureobasidium melanogenum]
MSSHCLCSGEKSLAFERSTLALTLGVGALGLAVDESLGGLIEGNAQRLGTHGGSTGIDLLALDLARTELLDLVLAVGNQAVGDDTGVLCVKGGDKVLPLCDDLAVLAELVRGLAEHVALDGLEQGGNVLAEVGDGDLALAGSELVTTGDGDDVLGAVLGAELDTEGNTLEFPMVEFPAGALVVAHVCLGADAGLEQNLLDGVGLVNGCMGVLNGDVEHLGEVLTQAVRGTSLDTTASGGNETFDGGGVVGTGELLSDGLAALDDGDCQQLVVNSLVVVENLKNLLASVLLGHVSGVTLLPQELARTDEGHGVLELPTDDVVPLVELEGKIALVLTTLGDPSDLSSETLNVILLTLQVGL